MNTNSVDLSVLEKIIFVSIFAIIGLIGLWMSIADKCQHCGSKITFRKLIDRVRQGDEILQIFEVVCIKCKNRKKTYVAIDIDDCEW